MALVHDEQETVDGQHRTEGAGRWRQCCAGGGVRGLGEMDRTDSGGHRVQEERQGAVFEWRAKKQATVRRGWNKDMVRDKVFDRG